MPERKFLQAGGAAIAIETASGGAAGDPPLAPKFVDALRALAQIVGQGLKEAAEKPDEVALSFHLGAAGDGRVVILRGPEEANFTVSFKWGGVVPAVKTPIPRLQ